MPLTWTRRVSSPMKKSTERRRCSTVSTWHRVDVEEVTGQHRRRLGTHQLRPGWSAPFRRCLDAVTAQDRPHAGRGKTHTHRGRLAMVLPIAQGRILPGQPHHQLDRSRRKSRPARPPVLPKRPPADQISMPEEHRLGLHDEPIPADLGHQPTQPSQGPPGPSGGTGTAGARTRR